MNKDQISTLAGGTAGLLLLNSVKWEAIAHGELLKVATAFVLIALGYLFYRNGGTPKDV